MAGRSTSIGWRGVGALAALALALAVGCAACASSGNPSARAKNIIVMISDGCGYNHIEATDFFESGKTGRQVYERFPVQVGVSTYPVDGGYDTQRAWSDFTYVERGATDSAAAATAMATGMKTYNGAIGVRPSGRALQNITEYAEVTGRSTGVVTTVEWSHATPASYVAHNSRRHAYVQIAIEMIDSSRVDVIMGAGSPWFDDNAAGRATADYTYVGGQATWDALAAGTAGGDADGDGAADPWTLIQTKAEFEALTQGDTPTRVCGTAQVATTLQQAREGDDGAAPYAVPLNAEVPDLATMTEGALNVLDENPKGFFLMIEGGAVDWAATANQSGRMIEEEIDFDRAVESVCAWVETHGGWSDTLLVVTGDHESGYLWGPGSDPEWQPIVDHGEGRLPGMRWGSDAHTNSLVPLFAKGVGAELLSLAAEQHDVVRGHYLDNTELGKLQFDLLR